LTRIVATLVTLAVIAGTSVAFAVSEKLKLDRAPIGNARFEPVSRRFSPVCDCPTRKMRLSYRFRRAETVDVTVVDAAGATVRTVVKGHRLSRGRHGFVWDGRADSGELLRRGSYRLRIRFLRERRSILSPIVFRIDTKKPRVRASLSTDVISPDGDGRNDKVKVTYRTGEKATAELLADGAVVAHVRGRSPKVLQTLYWNGTVPAAEGTRAEGTRVPAHRGDHALALRATDLAGNTTTVRFQVRVRFIELNAASYAAALGGQLGFSVDTDAASYRWYLFRPRGGKLGRPVLFDEHVTQRAVTVSIPADAKPGTFILRAAANGHRSRATVAVSRGAR
jgi:hypothetical protein